MVSAGDFAVHAIKEFSDSLKSGYDDELEPSDDWKKFENFHYNLSRFDIIYRIMDFNEFGDYIINENHIDGLLKDINDDQLTEIEAILKTADLWILEISIIKNDHDHGEYGINIDNKLILTSDIPMVKKSFEMETKFQVD